LIPVINKKHLNCLHKLLVTSIKYDMTFPLSVAVSRWAF